MCIIDGQWFCYLCVLTHKNPHSSKQNNLWYVSRRTQRSIHRSKDVFLVEYPVCVISVAVLVAVVKRRIFLLVFVVLYNKRSIISVNCNTEFWSLSSDYLCAAKDPGTHSNAKNYWGRYIHPFTSQLFEWFNYPQRIMSSS